VTAIEQGGSVIMRCFVLGAGFSKAANLPLATELTDLLVQRTAYPTDDGLPNFAREVCGQINGRRNQSATAKVSIEELFAVARELEASLRANKNDNHDLRQSRVSSYLWRLQERVVDVVVEREDEAICDPSRIAAIDRFTTWQRRHRNFIQL
jgi:hypothetical protein